MPIQDNHFSLFDLPARFALDAQELGNAYRRVQAQVHPDRFAVATPAERRVAMQWATRANEALQTLRSPMRRAAYLCELNGAPIDAESNTAMPAAFLAQQMQWREELDETRGSSDKSRMQALAATVDDQHLAILTELEQALDQRRDFAAAAALVRQLMFVEKFSNELAALTDPAAANAG